MNVRPGIFLRAMRCASVAGAASLGALVAGAAFAAPPALPANASPVTTGAIMGAEQTGAWPTFAGIPQAPKDVRSVAAWKRAVVEIEANGRQLVQMAAAEPWTLSDTQVWAVRQRAEATPPPPITTPQDTDTDAALAALRGRAKEPPRSH
jgi:hypothetical protein